ncbi:cell wall-binding repeat-containing protein [Kineococcus esterisolvens]|uniref:cell wall-binding repeat-containing protein n=1 Tax=unclassified Kineococcus TaxID=2621656 RepID=UPI003D7CCCEA
MPHRTAPRPTAFLLGGLATTALTAVVLGAAPAPSAAAPPETLTVACPPGLPVEHPGCGRTYPGADAANGTLELRGADRWATAVEAARTGFPDADVAVLVNGEDAHLVDALTAAPLARRLAAPVLLTTRDALPAVAAEHLRTRGISTVLVVGGAAAVAPVVLAQLAAAGVTDVGRVEGADRYATSRAVAALQPGAEHAWVASGADAHLVDALAAGGPAARLAEPLVLAPTTGDARATADQLRDAGVTSTTVVGGTAAVGDAVAAQFPAATRVRGGDRWTTAAAVAADAVLRGVSRTDLLVTSGDDAHLVDALATAPLGRATLLTGSGGAGTDLVRAWLAAGSDRTTFVGAAAADLVCWDATAACTRVTSTDVDGDGATDDVALAGAQDATTRQVRVRVRGDVTTLDVPDGDHPPTANWVGATALDDRPGAELVVLTGVGAHAEQNAVLTWRDGTLHAAPAPDGSREWFVDASYALNRGITCEEPGNITVRTTDWADTGGDQLIGTAENHVARDGAWTASGAASAELLTPGDVPDAYAGWHCPGLPRFGS